MSSRNSRESTSDSEGSDTVWFLAIQGSVLLPPGGCLGLTATTAESGLTHIVSNMAGNSLCAKKMLSVTLNCLWS